MSTIQRPKTGHELQGPGTFTFSGLRVPPDHILPPTLRTLTAELRAHQEAWTAAKRRHTELTSDQSRRAAEAADAQLLGQAVRADQKLPGPVNIQKLKDDLETCEQAMGRAEAAGRLVVADLDTALRAAAVEQAAACRQRIADARTSHADALHDLETARQELITATSGAAYWDRLATDGTARWAGRTDGRGASIRTSDGGRVHLEPFSQLVGSLRGEADRLARAVPDTPAEGAA